MAQAGVEDLRRLDRAHLIHPLDHPTDHAEPLVFVRGRGARLWDTEGREYLDGLSGLWNVHVGHGRWELGEAARAQMADLAFCSSYTGSSNIPAIRLAERLAALAYPNLTAVFFASGGGEANESAFKTARFYWKARGRPQKVKIIAREYAYHGVTLAAMSATGLSAYWPMFEPRVPGFVHCKAPYGFRHEGPPAEVGAAAAASLEETIQREGPETVAAVIAEPVQGAGGVIVPPADYFPRIRAICDRYDVLLVADEIITGFGRTGTWFALEHWGVQPDILSFAKGVTSGYLPLGGIMVSEAVKDAIRAVSPEQRWMHAYTYSGHPTCCAVALKNLEILTQERLVERAAEMGTYLLKQLESLYEIPAVGEVRGLGMMAAVELAEDRSERRPFDPALQLGRRVKVTAHRHGLFTRFVRDVLLLAPPLVTEREEIDRLVAALGASIREVLAEGVKRVPR